MCVCMCVHACERECLWVGERERERDCVCVCVCVKIMIINIDYLQTNTIGASIKSKKFWRWHERTWKEKMSKKDIEDCDNWLRGTTKQATPTTQLYTTRCHTDDCLGCTRTRYVTTYVTETSSSD